VRQGGAPSPDRESSSSAEKAREPDDGEDENHDDYYDQPTYEDAPPITGTPPIGSLDPVLLPPGAGAKTRIKLSGKEGGNPPERRAPTFCFA